MAKNDAKTQDKKAGTNVAKTDAPKGALILVQEQVPDHIKQNVARGSEQVGQDDLVIPRLEILQSQSPEVEEDNPEYIKGAKPGQLINSVTKQIYGSEVFIVPVHYSKLWLVWRKRTAGGGFLGSFPNPEDAEAKCKSEGGEDKGIEVIDTPTHLCLLVNREQGSIDEVMLSMPRTKAKVSRQWNSMIRLAGGDRFSRVYRITSQKETNDKGTYFNYVVASCGYPAKPVYDKAEKLYESIAKNARTIVMDVSGMGGDDAAASGAEM